MASTNPTFWGDVWECVEFGDSSLSSPVLLQEILLKTYPETAKHVRVNIQACCGHNRLLTFVYAPGFGGRRRYFSYNGSKRCFN